MNHSIKKLLFSLALISGLALGTAAVCSFADYTETVDGITYTYEIVDNGAMITGMSPVPRRIIMPDTLGGHPVTEFYARIDNGWLERVTIPSSLRSLRADAFGSCDNLNYNEYDNGYYLGTAENPYHALIKAKNEDITSCQINSDTKVIADYAFEDCSNLTSVTIPEGVKTIGVYAFWDCSRLESLTIPSSVIYMGRTPFLNCDNLNYNEYDNGLYLGTAENPYYALIKAKNKYITSCQINSDTKVIAGGAFEGCNNLTSIDIPENITRIEMYTFYSCNSLTSVTIPKNVTFIGLMAFNYYSLNDAFIPNECELGNYVFISRAKIWRYQVNSTQDGKTHVTITSVAKGDGSAVSGVCITADAMGENYVIDAVTIEGVQLEHTLAHTPAKAATCTEAGHIEGYTCDHCGKHFSDAEGTTEIAENSWVIAATGHAWSESWSTDEDNHWHECTKCGTKKDEAVHDWGAWAPVDETDTHKRTCGTCGAEETEEHTWEISEVTKEVTDTEDGEMKYECGTCGAEKVEVVPALENYVTDPLLEQTVDKDGVQIKLMVQDPYKVLPEGVQLEITELDDERKAQLDPTHPIENVAFFDIKLYTVNEDGVKTYISGELARKVRILWQIPEGWDEEDMEAVRITVGGDIDFDESIVTIGGVNYLAFWTNHFSPYASIDELTDADRATKKPADPAETAKKTNSTEESGSIETGDEINSYIMLEMVLFLASASLFVALRRRQKILLNEKK